VNNTDTVNFTGPRRHNGLLELGPFVDQPGEAQYPLYTDGLMRSGVVAGGVGYGKSRLVENIVISALSGGDTEYWYSDPLGGASSPALMEHAGWFTFSGHAGDLLDAAVAILDTRRREASAARRAGFTPSPDCPGLLIVIEECHRVFGNHDAAERWATVVNQGAEIGVAVLAVTQTLDLVAFGGNADLRAGLLAGNTVVFRSVSHTTRQITNLWVDPRSLPKIPGHAYVQPAAQSGVPAGMFLNRYTGASAGDWLAAQPRPGRVSRVSA